MILQHAVLTCAKTLHFLLLLLKYIASLINSAHSLVHKAIVSIGLGLVFIVKE